MNFDWKHALVFVIGALVSFGVVETTDVCKPSAPAVVVAAPADATTPAHE